MNQVNFGSEGGGRNHDERRAVEINAASFDSCKDDTAAKLANFPKYVRRQDLTKLLVRYELLKRVLNVKGSIIECGVFRGAGIMTWARLSALLEPNNILRKIYGFDSFEGFPAVGDLDSSEYDAAKTGALNSDSYDELSTLVGAFDLNRFLGHIPKVDLVVGDAIDTIPAFLKTHPHVVVSLLYLDFDLYEPTKIALEHFLPRMPRGSIIAFDELDNPAWPGETLAAVENSLFRELRLERFVFDPYVAYAVV